MVYTRFTHYAILVELDYFAAPVLLNIFSTSRREIRNRKSMALLNEPDMRPKRRTSRLRNMGKYNVLFTVFLSHIFVFAYVLYNVNRA